MDGLGEKWFMKQEEEQTFERLKREPFIKVVDMAAKHVWPDLDPESGRHLVLKIWGAYTPGMRVNQPTSEWLSDRIKSMGWTMLELFEEAARIRDGMEGTQRIAG